MKGETKKLLKITLDQKLLMLRQEKLKAKTEKQDKEFSDCMKGLTNLLATMSITLQILANSKMLPDQNCNTESVPQGNPYPYLANT